MRFKIKIRTVARLLTLPSEHTAEPFCARGRPSLLSTFVRQNEAAFAFEVFRLITGNYDIKPEEYSLDVRF